MADHIVKSQAEFDAAFEKHGQDAFATIIIDSPRGVWVEVRAYGSATVRAYGSATVRAYGSATVTAYGSATVTAYGSATVTASDSATVTASGSATVRAYDSATVRAYGSATVRASDSATVTASDSATVTASGSATVTASRFVAVHLWSQRVTLEGGAVIDMTAIDPKSIDDWCDYTGAQRDGDTITLYKAVDDAFNAGHGYKLTKYEPGSAVEVARWVADNECGNGLHLCATAWGALGFFGGATRFVECRVNVADVSTIGFEKLKARRVECVREVTVNHIPVEVTK